MNPDHSRYIIIIINTYMYVYMYVHGDINTLYTVTFVIPP